MSLAAQSPRMQRQRSTDPNAGMANIAEVNPQQLLQQGGMNPLVLGGGLNSLMQRKVGNNDMLRQLIAGMSGNGLFGQ